MSEADPNLVEFTFLQPIDGNLASDLVHEAMEATGRLQGALMRFHQALRHGDEMGVAAALNQITTAHLAAFEPLGKLSALVAMKS